MFLNVQFEKKNLSCAFKFYLNLTLRFREEELGKERGKFASLFFEPVHLYYSVSREREQPKPGRGTGLFSFYYPTSLAGLD